MYFITVSVFITYDERRLCFHHFSMLYVSYSLRTCTEIQFNLTSLWVCEACCLRDSLLLMNMYRLPVLKQRKSTCRIHSWCAVMIVRLHVIAARRRHWKRGCTMLFLTSRKGLMKWPKRLTIHKQCITLFCIWDMEFVCAVCVYVIVNWDLMNRFRAKPEASTRSRILSSK